MADKLPKMVAKAIGARIKERREALGINQSDLGERLDLGDHSPVGQWERGETLIGTLNLVLCAEELELSLDYLVWGMGNNIDARLLNLPSALRESLAKTFMGRIEEAEKLVREHPELFTDQSVKDGDKRLRGWSAHRKLRVAEAMKKRHQGAP